jgi:hypothetical protein
VIVVGGGWYLYKNMDGKKTAGPVEQTATTTEQQAVTPPPPSLITSNDTTDAGITADLAAVDAQMGVVTQDATAADASLSDKQITQ